MYKYKTHLTVLNKKIKQFFIKLIFKHFIKIFKQKTNWKEAQVSI